MINKKELENKDDVILLVDTFYKKAIHDSEIGHFFNDVIQLDWDSHMPKMYDFWETTLFHSAAYKGNPVKVHQDLDDKSKMTTEHFAQWLLLFKQTVDELFEGIMAETTKQRAESIATVMMIKLHQK